MSLKRTKRTKHLLHSKPEALYRPKRIRPARPGGGLQVARGLVTCQGGREDNEEHIDDETVAVGPSKG